MSELVNYGSLFLAAFLSATLLPGSSEAVLVGLVVSGRGEPWSLLAAATIGNTLGSIVTWGCGRFLANYRDRPWFPVTAARYERAAAWFARYGVWSLLLSWVPVIGDGLAVAAGSLRVPLALFTGVVGLGKFVRYAAVYALAAAV